MKIYRFIVMASVLLLLIPLAGCTGSDQEQATQSLKPGMIEPEQLISQEEAEALLGGAAQAEKSENAAIGQKLCIYRADGTDSVKLLRVGITQQAFFPKGSSDTPELQFEADKEGAGGESAVVDGPGDAMILIPNGYDILCSGYLLQITAEGAVEGEMDAMLDAASEIAVENLKNLIGQELG